MTELNSYIVSKSVQREVKQAQTTKAKDELLTPKQVNVYTLSFMILTAFLMIGFIAG